MNAQKLMKYLADAVPLGPHPAPHSEWVSVRLDVLQASIAALDAAQGATLEVTAAIEYVDKAALRKLEDICYETMQRSGFKRKTWTRKYTLADARRDAAHAAKRLRNAWELLDPIEPKTPRKL